MNQLGKYQLIAEIARGGMGIVYLAVVQGPARFSKLVVVKELKPELVDDGAFLEMFLEEARLAARLHHPNIVQTNEVGHEGNRHFMVMDYLEGATLGRVIARRRGSFPLPMQLAVLSDVLNGLHHAHTLTDFDGTSLHLVHRDVSPQNVFLTHGGEAKLVDFGIAKALDSTIETSAGIMKGKPAYMAREQITGDADARADVFSVGVMLWEAVAGRRMWERKTDVEVLSAVLAGDTPPLADAVPDAPAELVRICGRALATPRDQRYASAAEMQADLDAYRRSSGIIVSMRDVGQLVAETFAAERARTQALIETHLTALREGRGASSLLRLPASTNDPTSSPSGASASTSAAPSLPSSPSVTATGTQAGTSADVPRASTRTVPLLAGVALGLVAAAIAVGVVMHDDARRPAVAASPSASITAAVVTPPPVPAAATHDITVSVVPTAAVLTMDGRPMGNPGTRLCVAGETVIVRATANGYLPRDREVPCDGARSIDIVLEPEPHRPALGIAPLHPATVTRPPVVTAPEPKPAPPARPADVSPAGGARPQRPIETASPYGTP